MQLIALKREVTGINYMEMPVFSLQLIQSLRNYW